MEGVAWKDWKDTFRPTKVQRRTAMRVKVLRDTETNGGGNCNRGREHGNCKFGVLEKLMLYFLCFGKVDIVIIGRMHWKYNIIPDARVCHPVSKQDG